MWTVNFLMFKLVLEKAEEPEVKLPRSAGSWKKQENSRKLLDCFIDCAKAFDSVESTRYGKFFKRLESQTTLPASWETKKQELEPAMEQGTGSKLGKEYIKAMICHPAYLTYMQSTSRKMSVEG